MIFGLVEAVMPTAYRDESPIDAIKVSDDEDYVARSRKENHNSCELPAGNIDGDIEKEANNFIISTHAICDDSDGDSCFHSPID